MKRCPAEELTERPPAEILPSRVLMELPVGGPLAADAVGAK